MNKQIVIILAIFLFPFFGSAQQWRTAPLEVFGGISNFHYFGDIGGTSNESNFLGLADINLRTIRPGLHLGARYQVVRQLNVRASLASGFIYGTDVGGINENRNYAFRSFINELAVAAEYYLIPESDQNYYYSIMQMRSGLRHFRQPFSLYITAGAGGIYYNVTPRESLETSDRFYDGKSFALAIPIGIGVKYMIMPRTSIGAELSGRFTTTNYLDGFASEYGQYNDLYHSLIIKVNYKIQKSRKQTIGVPRRRFLF